MPTGIGRKSGRAKHGSICVILTIYSEPAIEPVSIADAKDHLRVSGNDEDAYISSLITAARQQVENTCGRALITQTWDMWVDQFPYSMDYVDIPKAPLQSVTSITYVDTAGATQTLSSSVYTVDSDSIPGRVYLAYNQTWPDVRSQRKAVKIRYVAGYGPTKEDVPLPIRHAMLLLIAHFYENREPINIGNTVTPIPLAFESLLMPYRLAYL